MRLINGFLPALVVMAGAGEAMANDLPAIQADIEAAEKRYEAMAPGDVPTGQAIIDSFNALAAKLKTSDMKGKPEWKVLVDRSQALDKKVRARAAEPPPPTAGIVKAKALLDEIDAGYAAQRPGDVAAANALIKKNNDAVDLLSATTANERRASIFGECAARVKGNDARIRARLAEPAGAAGAGAGATGGAGTGTGTGTGAGGGGPDGLDLAIDTSAFSSIDDYNWRSFKDTYTRYVAQLRAGDLKGHPDTIRESLASMQAGPKTQAAIAQAKALIERYGKVREERLAAIEKARAAQAGKDSADAGEIDKILADLDGHFGKEFSAVMTAPFDAANARRWVAKLKEWDGLRAKGTAMIAKIKVDYPRFAMAATVTKMERWFASGLAAKLAYDVRATTGALSGSGMTSDGLLASRIVKGYQYLQSGFFREDLLADDAWMSAALKEMGESVQAIEALRVVRVEHQGRPLEADIDARGKALTAALDKYQGAASAAYENARMPKSANPDASAVGIASAAIVESGTPADGIARIVVHYGPTPYETKRESTSAAGGDWIRIQRWTERGEEMQCTTAEKVNGDTRMVTYDLRIIKVGHPDSPHGRWFCAGRFEGRRIKPENVAK